MSQRVANRIGGYQRKVRFLTGIAIGAGAGYLLRRRGEPRPVAAVPAPPRTAVPGRHGGVEPPPGGGAGPVLGPVARPASLKGAPSGDALVLLAREHDELRDELESLLAFEVDGPHDAGDLRAAVQRVVSAGSRHEVAEEEHFWPVVRRVLPDGDALADTGCAHELALKRVLQALDTRRPGDIDFEDLLHELSRLVTDHIAFEEGTVWPGLDTVMTERDRLDMGTHLGRAEELAPTRPHPSELADPNKHPAISRAVAMLDRGVDRVAARGRGPRD